MTAGQTKLATMVNPEVMADMVSAKLPKLIKFTPLAYVETALQGQPGNALTVPAWEYAGDATEVGEGQAISPDQLTTKKTTMTIKKAAKGYEITDEALLSGLGDPLGQATYQLGLAIANKYGAFVIMLKRDVAIETDRDILKKTTVITGDEHYGVYLYDPTRVVKFGEG
ncbi:MHP [Streptococcus pneumoniae]|nr:MHP [Streptococcus pneumoniae]VLS17968.1 MHP [Streptococcus pneumoniae]VLZ78777.1 MHP [Streptococcus pneumoniae]VRJ63248.1 MHP [Streptococcus pneumoniae]